MNVTNEAATTLKNGGIAIIPSDTLYGIMGSAVRPDVVEKIYEIRGRDRSKPLIVLLPTPESLADFGVHPIEKEQKLINAYWPGKVTIIFEVDREDLSYLHRGTHSIAFRVPQSTELRELLKETGPLVAPSANPEGKKPAHTIAEARAYFADSVGHYEDKGVLEGAASTLIQVKSDRLHILRPGAVEINEKVLS